MRNTLGSQHPPALSQTLLSLHCRSILYHLSLFQFSSVAQSCLTLCDSMDCSTPSLPVHHQLLELAQTHVRQFMIDIMCSDAIQPSHPLFPPSPLALNLSQHRVFPVSQIFASGGQSIGVSASASALAMNIQDLFPLGLTCLISFLSEGLSRVFSNTTQFKSINSLELSLLYGPTLTSIHNYWTKHSLQRWTFVGKVMSLLF